ncbi:MAG: hypothetical protein PHO32_00050 [Candidatus Cloacimonetes bacterium]|nr:hypothetical protein [Candidatus Cloacimonadota bacterium]
MNKRIFMFLTILVLWIATINAQTEGDWRTRATGSWDNASGWQKYVSESWVNQSTYP